MFAEASYCDRHQVVYDDFSCKKCRDELFDHAVDAYMRYFTRILDEHRGRLIRQAVANRPPCIPFWVWKRLVPSIVHRRLRRVLFPRTTLREWNRPKAKK